jgi:hypothetical protein
VAQKDLLSHLEGQMQILVMAANDMLEAIAACNALEHEEAPGPFADALATAICVSYARPFSSSNKIGRLPAKFTPSAATKERELHEWLLAERDRRYAHTDADADRLVLHSGDPEIGDPDGWVEIKLPFPRERLDAIRGLAEALHEKLSAQASKVQRQAYDEFRRPVDPA